MSDITTGQLVVFSLGDEEYALPISYVHEIIRYAPPRTVASADPSVRGVISLRGKIIPVFDLATRLGVTREEAHDRAKIVIVETETDGNATLAGVVVDDVEEVITVQEDQIDHDGGRTVTGEAIEGIAKIADRLVVLLSPEQIVATRDVFELEDAAADTVETTVTADATSADATAVAA